MSCHRSPSAKPNTTTVPAQPRKQANLAQTTIQYYNRRKARSYSSRWPTARRRSFARSLAAVLYFRGRRWSSHSHLASVLSEFFQICAIHRADITVPSDRRRRWSYARGLAGSYKATRRFTVEPDLVLCHSFSPSISLTISQKRPKEFVGVRNYLKVF
jgi:hypothetical protein